MEATVTAPPRLFPQRAMVLGGPATALLVLIGAPSASVSATALLVLIGAPIASATASSSNVCSDRLLGNGGSATSDNYIQFPRISGSTRKIRAVTMWVYVLPEAEQTTTGSWKYLLDARSQHSGQGCAKGYVAKVGSTGSTSVGQGGSTCYIKRIVETDFQGYTTARQRVWQNPPLGYLNLNSFQIRGGTWRHYYIEFSNSWSGPMRVGARYKQNGGGMEDLEFRALSVTFWRSTLTYGEIRQLTDGESSLQDSAKFLIQYNPT